MNRAGSRRSRAGVFGVAVLALSSLSVLGAARPGAAPPAQTPTTAPAAAAPGLAPPKGSILVDADTGRVLSQHNATEPLLAGSTTKILTALIVRRHVPLTASVPVSPRAESMPARKLSIKAGQTWNAGDLLRAMLLCSCNDVAVALAEKAGGGSMERFDALAAQEAKALRLRDHPTLRDPAGLDDEFSVGGGNLVSARDLAISAAALLEDPVLKPMVAAHEYRWHGGDDRDHHVQNHNQLLALYPGAIGVKTGYTKRSGNSLVAAATRNGRTMIAVLIASANTYLQAAQLLDRGFATRAAAERSRDRLAAPRAAPAPAVHRPEAAPRSPATDLTASKAAGVQRSSGGGGAALPTPVRFVLILLAVGVGLVVVRRRQVVRRRRRRALARARARARFDLERAQQQRQLR